MWPELKEQLEVEQAQLRQLFEIHRPLLEKCRIQEPEAIELSALGAFLHSFHTGLHWEKMAPLVHSCEETFARLQTEIAVFISRENES